VHRNVETEQEGGHKTLPKPPQIGFSVPEPRMACFRVC
jgi:hypothetical protein